MGKDSISSHNKLPEPTSISIQQTTTGHSAIYDTFNDQTAYLSLSTLDDGNISNYGKMIKIIMAIFVIILCVVVILYRFLCINTIKQQTLKVTILPKEKKQIMTNPLMAV